MPPTPHISHRSADRFQKTWKTAGWVLVGIVSAGAVLDAFTNATQLVTPFVTYIGTALIVAGTLVLHILMCYGGVFWEYDRVRHRLRRLGPKPTAIIIGVLALLWYPRIVDAVAIFKSAAHSAWPKLPRPVPAQPPSWALTPPTIAPEHRPAAGASKGTFSPAPPMYPVTIVTAPALADITIDGRFVGKSHRTVTIAAGQHDLEISKDGFTTYRDRVSVPQQSLISVDLVRKR